MKNRILTAAVAFVLGTGVFAIAQTTGGTGGTSGGQGTAAGQTFQTDTRDDDQDWGWIGLLGLAGLAGLRRRSETHEVRTSHAGVGVTTR